MVLVFILGPVGSGRDRKNEEKVTKSDSDLVLLETLKKESGLFFLNYLKTFNVTMAYVNFLRIKSFNN